MEAKKVINLIEKIEKTVKVGAYTTYSLKKKSKSSRGRIIINVVSGVNKSKIDSIFKEIETVRIKAVNNLHKNVDMLVTIK